MFVLSIKSSKLKIILAILAVVVAALILFFISHRKAEVSHDGAINYSAKNAEERLSFLAQFGWDVGDDPIEVAEVIIPAEFDEVYSGYNEIQKEQNLDLKNYASLRVKRWTYAVYNYPGLEDSVGIRANLLIYEGRVIGGDISSIALDGFMHGFENDDLMKKEKDKNKSSKKETSEDDESRAGEIAKEDEETKKDKGKSTGEIVDEGSTKEEKKSKLKDIFKRPKA